MDKLAVAISVVFIVLFAVVESRDRWFRAQEEKEDDEEPAGA